MRSRIFPMLAYLFVSLAASTTSQAQIAITGVTEATGGGGTAFTTPPYTATLDAASGVSAAVQSGAGPK